MDFGDSNHYEIAPLMLGVVEKDGTGPNSLRGIYEIAKKDDANIVPFGQWLLDIGLTEKIVRFDDPDVRPAFITPSTVNKEEMKVGTLVAVIASKDGRGFNVVVFGVACPEPKYSIPGLRSDL